MTVNASTTATALPGDRSEAPRAAGRDLVSVVVITYNRAAALLTALRSVAQMETGGRFDAEILVVDNGSTDDTAGVVRRFADECPFPVRYALETNAGIPFARNRGVREARGGWVCFFDDDQTAEPDWLRELYSAAVGGAADCAGGARDLVGEGGLPTLGSAVARRLLGEVDPDEFAEGYHLKRLPNTGNVLVRRAVFDAVGGFDEGALEGGDDTDFFHRLLRSGRRAVFAPDALVHHHIPADRLTDEYVQWVAVRHGVVIGRLKLSAGRFSLLSSFAGRCLQATLVLAPRYAAMRLLGKRDAAFDALCLLRRVQGYARFVRHALTPKRFRGERALGSFHHRGSSTVARSAAVETTPQTPGVSR